MHLKTSFTQKIIGIQGGEVIAKCSRLFRLFKKKSKKHMAHTRCVTSYNLLSPAATEAGPRAA